jgi:RNA polymerase sigma-70 factor, ECF subfamily
MDTEGLPMTVASPDEQDARDMARLVAGHDSALNDLMERHAPRLFHYLVRLLRDEDDAADLAQETFLRVYQSRNRFNLRRSFATWLYTIASNLVRDRFRWRSRHPQASLDAQTEAHGNAILNRSPMARTDPSQDLQARERADAVQQAVAALPDELRVPLLLAEYEQQPQAAIAEILNCSVKAVETRIYRARKQLRARLEPLLQSI